jgi:hypothetical protein
LQDIVDLIFPELAAEDAEAERAFNASGGVAAAAREQSPVKRQRLNHSSKTVPPTANAAAAVASTTTAAATSSAATASTAQPEDHVTFHLLPAPNVEQPLPALEKTVLRTTATITVQALAKFVMKKLKLVNVTAAQVFCFACLVLLCIVLTTDGLLNADFTALPRQCAGPRTNDALGFAHHCI